MFSPADFAGLGSRAAVDKVLSRLTASGELRRLARGLYDRPGTPPSLPCVEEIARALAGKNSACLQACGAYAAKLLGMSEQMPLKIVFLTDGASRTVLIGNRQIVLKPATPRNLATAGRVSGLVIQTLRFLRQPNVDERLLDQLRTRLTKEDRAVLLADVSFAPAWIAGIMRRLASEIDKKV